MTSEKTIWFSSAYVVFITDTDAARQDGTFVSGSMTQSKSRIASCAKLSGNQANPSGTRSSTFTAVLNSPRLFERRTRSPVPMANRAASTGFICKNPLGSICSSPFEWVDSFPEWNRLWTSPSWTVPSGRTARAGRVYRVAKSWRYPSFTYRSTAVGSTAGGIGDRPSDP